MGRETHQLGCILSLAFSFSLASDKNFMVHCCSKTFKVISLSFPSSSHAFSLLLYLEKRIGTSDVEKF